MANERVTENIVRDTLRGFGYYSPNNGIVIEEQKSQIHKVKTLLSIASKKQTGFAGYPEFIVSTSHDSKFLIVVECKADTKMHASASLDDPAKYAVDGVLHYARHLAKDYTVVAVAVSGSVEHSLKISNFIFSPGSNEGRVLTTEGGKDVDAILSFDDYYRLACFDPAVASKRHEDLLAFSRELHEFIWTKAKVDEGDKPLLVSGTLIALMNESFRKTFDNVSPGDIPDTWLAAIKRVLDEAEIPQGKKDTMIQPYSAIAVHPNLAKPEANVAKEFPQGVFREIILMIYEKVWPYINVYHDFDVVGQFYGEFLKYTGGDKKALGIVLTPRHVSELFSMLANVGPTSTVLDICTGTGGFLISAMQQMLKKATTDAERIDIRKNRLIGIENSPRMFALAASNMILRGDGKANLHQGSCFNEAIIQAVKKEVPDVGLLNPPYSQSKTDVELSELHFVKKMLECLKLGGTGIAIVPMSCAISFSQVREDLMKAHTLEAVMSMPADLFAPVGTVTCIMVWSAHIPHATSDRKTWFGYWRDDGFYKTKNLGRSDLDGKWMAIRDQWVSMYRNREVVPGLSVLQKVGSSDEWCAEAYMETNYTKLTPAGFDLVAKDFAIHQLRQKSGTIKKEASDLVLDGWGYFELSTLFDIKKGKRLTKRSMIAGATPFIGASDSNNGQTGTVGQNPIHEGGTISVSYNGSVAEAYYQPAPFWASDDVNVLYPKLEMSPAVCLFICTVIRAEKYRFNYGRKWHLDRMMAAKIKLPKNENGNLDTSFIEKYMKLLPSFAHIG